MPGKRKFFDQPKKRHKTYVNVIKVPVVQENHYTSSFLHYDYFEGNYNLIKIYNKQTTST